MSRDVGLNAKTQALDGEDAGDRGLLGALVVEIWTGLESRLDSFSVRAF